VVTKLLAVFESNPPPLHVQRHRSTAEKQLDVLPLVHLAWRDQGVLETLLAA
jgi:hypothetical protein